MIISPEQRKEKLMEFVEVTKRSPLGELLTQEITKDVTKELTKDLTQELTKDLTQKIKKDLTQKIKKDVTQELTQKITKNNKSETIIKLLTRKLGDLPQELQNQISNAGIETLELMLYDIFVINSLEDVKKYLG